MRRRVAFGSERRRRRAQAKARACKRSLKKGGGAKVSDKLEALKNLIPMNNDGEVVKADQLFEETADYIVRLRNQVSVLQRLIQLYGSPESQHNNAVVL